MHASWPRSKACAGCQDLLPHRIYPKLRRARLRDQIRVPWRGEQLVVKARVGFGVLLDPTPPAIPRIGPLALPIRSFPRRALPAPAEAARSMDPRSVHEASRLVPHYQLFGSSDCVTTQQTAEFLLVARNWGSPHFPSASGCAGLHSRNVPDQETSIPARSLRRRTNPNQARVRQGAATRTPQSVLVR